VPQWDLATTLALAGEVEALLTGPDVATLLHHMYGDAPAVWSETLQGPERWRFVINVLTRIRFVAPDGALDLQLKDSAEVAPPGLVPWFEVPGRRTAGVPIAFGHWSTLGLRSSHDLLALDTGCVWGGALTAVRVDGGRRDVTQVQCGKAQATE
jgi:bis(5'-nucleosyl)-tetraphosphatase (symmetrical)